MLKPSLRTRYRYVRFIVIGDDAEKVDNVELFVYREIVRFIGMLGVSEMGIRVMSKDNTYFVRVKREYVNTLRGILPLINSLGNYNARPQIVVTSGTIKKVIKKRWGRDLNSQVRKDTR